MSSPWDKKVFEVKMRRSDIEGAVKNWERAHPGYKMTEEELIRRILARGFMDELAMSFNVFDLREFPTRLVREEPSK